MLIAILSGFVIAFVLLGFGRLLKNKLPMFASALPAGLFLFFLSYVPGVAGGETYNSSTSWIPSLGVNLDFRLDGLSLLFSLLITGIGTLIFFYSDAYMNGHRYINRFYSFLCLFMGSMLGLVLSDNALLLFVFWELTAISSFFLIGFNNQSQASRRSSLLAWAITGGGGFFLMAGLILLGSITGTFSIQEMASSAGSIKEHSLYALILFTVFLGAFSKSAQFPFHFWLPGAMKAPTPVSAYLHSATMVKAGIYLIARFSPVLGDHAFWNNTLIIVGGFTMIYSAFHSIFRLDLKGILAYSTISALGMLMFLLGLGTESAYLAAMVFIGVHAFYKAGLFLTTGTIDLSTRTRDIRYLSGLRKVMPTLAVAGLLAALSSAGIPLTFGFVGKELIYEATWHHEWGMWGLTMLAVVSNILLSYSGYLAGIRPFTGTLDGALEVRKPGTALWLAPLILGAGGVIVGISPAFANGLAEAAVAAISEVKSPVSLSLWHGFNEVFIASMLTVIVGVALFLVLKPSEVRLSRIARAEFLSPHQLFNQTAAHFKRVAVSYTSYMHNGFLRSYITKIVFFSVCLLAYYMIRNVEVLALPNSLTTVSVYEAIIFVIMFSSVLIILFSDSRLLAVIAMSMVGFCICLFFVYYGAPDLAMTQFSIDTLTTVLFVMVLLKLPPYLKMKDRSAQIRDGLLAAAFGTLVSLIALQVLAEPTSKDVSRFYAENAYLLAKGKNVVNVILVDFRGYDTLVEITVLTIAAIGVYSMLKINSSEVE